MAILAAWRLTEIVLLDAIFTPVRKLFPKAGLFFSCGRCVSVWAGGLATVAFYFFPWANWPFGLSIIFLLADQFTTATKRRIVVYLDQQRIDWGGVTQEQGTQILNQVVVTLQKRKTA